MKILGLLFRSAWPKISRFGFWTLPLGTDLISYCSAFICSTFQVYLSKKYFYFCISGHEFGKKSSPASNLPILPLSKLGTRLISCRRLSQNSNLDKAGVFWNENNQVHLKIIQKYFTPMIFQKLPLAQFPILLPRA